jgi:hypothetical protein
MARDGLEALSLAALDHVVGGWTDGRDYTCANEMRQHVAGGDRFAGPIAGAILYPMFVGDCAERRKAREARATGS